MIKACAAKREGHYRITPGSRRGSCAPTQGGYVHSFEVWNGEGKLVGGGYGVAVGRVFTTESQFSLEPNTSKIGFSVLNWHLARWGFLVNDGKGATPTILDMGFRPIPRADFLRLLEEDAGQGGKGGTWSVEEAAGQSAGGAAPPPAETGEGGIAWTGPRQAQVPQRSRCSAWNSVACGKLCNVGCSVCCGV